MNSFKLPVRPVTLGLFASALRTVKMFMAIISAAAAIAVMDWSICGTDLFAWQPEAAGFTSRPSTVEQSIVVNVGKLTITGKQFQQPSLFNKSPVETLPVKLNADGTLFPLFNPEPSAANPNDPTKFVVLAEKALSEGRFNEAANYLDQANGLMAFVEDAQRKTELQSRILVGRAALADAAGDPAKAQSILESAQQLEPKNAAIFLLRAKVVFEQKDADQAYEILKKAKEIDPTVLQPEAALALLYEDYPDHKKAVTWMENALKAAPKDRDTLMAAAQWALETDQIDDAKNWSSDAIKLHDMDYQAKILRGLVALLMHDYRGAEIYCQSAFLESPGNFSASMYYTLALLALKDIIPKQPVFFGAIERNQLIPTTETTDDRFYKQKRQIGLEFAEDNVKRFPRSTEAVATLGWAYYKNGRLAEAEQCLNLALSATPVTPDMLYYLAVIYADTNRLVEARKLLLMAKNSGAINRRQFFIMRSEAEELLEKIPFDK
jgi:tetratricopeptide (TPR) repeat protein